MHLFGCVIRQSMRFMCSLVQIRDNQQKMKQMYDKLIWFLFTI